jgi:hypothetical protein
MKVFKANKNIKIEDKYLTPENRVANLESKINQLSRHMVLMARGYIILLFAIAVTFYLSDHTLNKVNREENHTQKVQAAGAPTGVCLREAMKAGLPILINFANDLEKAESKTPDNEKPVVQLFVSLTRKAESPLKSYVSLQEKRYIGIKCPKS